LNVFVFAFVVTRKLRHTLCPYIVYEVIYARYVIIVFMLAWIWIGCNSNRIWPIRAAGAQGRGFSNQ